MVKDTVQRFDHIGAAEMDIVLWKECEAGENEEDEVEHLSLGQDTDEVVSSPSDSVCTAASPASLGSAPATTPLTTPEPPEDMTIDTHRHELEYGLSSRRSRPVSPSN